MASNKISFGKWFLNGYEGSKSGFRRMFDFWLIIHIMVGFFFAFIIDTPIKDISRVILLPLMGILIGLTFAWAGNAQGFIQTKEIIDLSKNKPGGYIDYVFVYQFSIFMVLLCTGLWAFAAFDIKEIKLFSRPIHPKYLSSGQKVFLKAFLYFVLSFTIREAWSTIQGVHYFLIVKNKIYERNENSKEGSQSASVSQSQHTQLKEKKDQASVQGVTDSHSNKKYNQRRRKNKIRLQFKE